MQKASFSKRVIGTCVFCLALLCLVLCLHAAFNNYDCQAAPQRRPRARTQKPKTSPKPKINYAGFSHTTHVVNQKLACSSCHKVPSKNWNVVRKGDAAFADVADFPEHSSCLECHRTQFFARERPAPAICSNCHIAVSPRDTARWLFPSLGDLTDPKLKRRDFVSEFAVGFPHDKHIDVVGWNAPSERQLGSFINAAFQEKKPAPPKSCPVCHETYQPQGNSSEEYLTKPPKNLGDNFWLKKGTFKTIPNSHAICFTCHNSDSGIAPEPKNCEVCHKLAPARPAKVDFDSQLATTMGADQFMLARWSRRMSSGAFRHEGGEHPDLNCLDCHHVDNPTFSTVDPHTMRVAVKSCGGGEGCHITPTTNDGGVLNFEIDSKKKDANFVCTKCHVTFGKEATPESHPFAIAKPK
ncbi:MAG TPA: cytochrome c3 family protein [Pyrinomonadaceae bacterium]|nr:cytochrome c3 family protein [Pyrinomonadaceae bacterium]